MKTKILNKLDELSTLISKPDNYIMTVAPGPNNLWREQVYTKFQAIHMAIGALKSMAEEIKE